MRMYVVLFVVLCAAQWYVPLSMVAEQEDVLQHGRVYRFKTAPIDPSDPFRGKYVTLRFESELVSAVEGKTWQRNAEVFVVVKVDDNGFAVVDRITENTPEQGTDYFPAEVRTSGADHVRLRFPFERFYLEESKAPAVEELYRDSHRDTSGMDHVYALVRIRSGVAVVEDVQINGRSVADIVHARNADGD